MKFYLQFYTKNLAGEKMQAMGSDGVFILDGRNTLANMIIDGHKRAYQLRFVEKFIGFKVMRCSRYFDGQAITDIMIKITYPDKFCIERGYDYQGISINGGP